MDLSKPSDCLPHDLAVVKLEAYCHIQKWLQLIRDYLSCHKEKTKIGSDFNWASAIGVVSRIGSILGPLLFNILLITFFMSLKIQIFVILQVKTLCIPIAATFP